jgi:hypothetical protein
MHGQPHIGCYVNLHKWCRRKITKNEACKHGNIAKLQRITYCHKKLLLRTRLFVNPVCRCEQHRGNLHIISLHKPHECFSPHNWLPDNVQISTNLGSISKFITPEWCHRGSNVLWRGVQKYNAPLYKIQITTTIRRSGIFIFGETPFFWWCRSECRRYALCLCFYFPGR